MLFEGFDLTKVLGLTGCALFILSIVFRGTPALLSSAKGSQLARPAACQ
jgi:hypothetical protein